MSIVDVQIVLCSQMMWERDRRGNGEKREKREKI
jgi:hypothetical protein